MRACLKKDRQAQRELYDRFSPTMKGICMRYARSEHDAEDILQDSFINVFRKLDYYKEKGTLGGWIRRITVNKAIEYYRRESSITKHKSEYKLEIQNDSSTEMFQTIDLNLILEKVQKLADGYRMVFNLYAIEGYNHREIGEIMNISEGTSKSQFARAKKLLQETIKKEMNFDKQIEHYVK